MKLQELCESIRPPEESARQKALARQDTLTKPRGSLGSLESLSAQVAAIQDSERPQVEQHALVLAAGSHGIADEGVSPYPSSVTAQMVLNFLRGGAAANALASTIGTELVLVDAGVNGTLPKHPRLRDEKMASGTNSFVRGPAMSEEHAVEILGRGAALAIELSEKGIKMLALGEMGIGNTSSAAAITSVTLNRPAKETVGRGALIDDEGFERKIALISEALELHRGCEKSGVSILSALGGYELGYLAGVILGAAASQLVVVLDGYPSTAAALIAERICPLVPGYLCASHRSCEPGHQLALEHLSLSPHLELGMRLGEGSGALLMLPVLSAACRCLNEMHTFTEASVDDIPKS